MTEIFMWYTLINVAFLITSLFTFHFPSWRMARVWAVENLDEHSVPSIGYIMGHTLIYMVLGFIVFPVLAVAIIFANKEAVRGYTKALIEMLMRSDHD